MTFSGHDDSTINIVLELLLLLLLHGKRPKKTWTACFLYSRTETEAATQNTHSWMETNAYATFFYFYTETDKPNKNQHHQSQILHISVRH